MTISEENKNKLNFPQFDVVTEISDHRYLDPKFSKPLKPNGAAFKAISKEWRILQESLPKSIFVRVSEARFDLLRAAIIGAAGTPYHDGIFIFDISIPPNYPKCPPKIVYRSHGFRLNTNLYANGTVCLSLLNTWAGNHRCERWNSKQSTILQVLLSIQSLVLNEKPYYNEPGIQHSSDEKMSEHYSQNSFVLTCKSMIALMRNPPMNFESLIQHHFQHRGTEVLKACEAYANGKVFIGFYGCGGNYLPKFEIRKKFQDDVELIYGTLAIEFSKLDANLLSSAPEQLELKRVIKPKEEKKKKGFLRRIIGMILHCGKEEE